MSSNYKCDECGQPKGLEQKVMVLETALWEALDSIQYAADYLAGGSPEMEQHGTVKELRADAAKIRAILNKERTR